MSKNFAYFRPIVGMISGTLCSRILGLIRDSVFFAFLGSSLYASSFLLAFSIPNLFRRLWGEGALSSAFIPVFSENFVKNKANAWTFLNAFITRLGIFLAAFIVLSCFLLLIARVFVCEEQSILGINMTIAMMPYMLFICLAAILNGALNVLNAFKICAFAPVILNAIMIASLVFGHGLGLSIGQQVWMLAASVLLAGAIQLIMPFWWLGKISNWTPRLTMMHDANLRKVWNLFLPGLFGAAVFQINAFIGRFLAFFIDDKSVSILYLANRFLELPLGLFAFSIVTVILPKLSIFRANGDTESATNTYKQGVTLLMTILLPASAGIIVLAKPILQLFFQWGNFCKEDIDLTIPVLQIFAIGLPIYGISSLLTRVFHAQHDTRTPVNVAVISMFVYVTTALITMFNLRAVGLAVASLASVSIQFALLYKKLTNKHAIYSIRCLLRRMMKWIAASAIIGALMHTLYATTWQDCTSKISILLCLSASICASAAIYWIILLLVDNKSTKLWLNLVKK